MANRIQRNKEATEPNQWHYVATEKNPADCASRGLNATEVISSSLFSGPSFLWKRELPKEETNHGELPQNVPEMKQAYVLMAGTQEELMLNRHELAKSLKEINERRVQQFLEAHGCDFMTNVPSSSHLGGVWERQIRTIRNILTAILYQNNSRLDNCSLRTFVYETVAIVNSRPLAIENINDPLGPEALTPNHLQGTSRKKTFMPESDGDEYSIWRTSSGQGGRRNTWPISK